MLLGDRFGISTVIVILSVLFWGFIWGPVGMLLAVPLTMLVKVMLDNSSDFRWISALMGKGTGDSEAGEEEAAPAAN
jgi:predicted PurR-regulated permease PerM